MTCVVCVIIGLSAITGRLLETGRDISMVLRYNCSNYRMLYELSANYFTTLYVWKVYDTVKYITVSSVGNFITEELDLFTKVRKPVL